MVSPEASQNQTALGEILVEGTRQSNDSPEKPSAFANIVDPQSAAYHMSTLPELLAEQVGLHVQSFGGLGQLSTLSIRGSTAEQVSVFVDGVKINTAQGGAVDFSTLPLGAVERIEVLRGGSSAQFGSDAIGGVVNIITRRPKEKYSLELKQSFGSFLTLSTHAGFSKKWKKWGGTFDYNHFSSRGNFSFSPIKINLAGAPSFGGRGDFTRQHNGFLSESLLGRIETEVSDHMSLSLTNDFFFTSRDLPGTVLETTQLLPQNPLEAHETLWRNTVGLQLRWQDMGTKGLRFSLLPHYKTETSHFRDPSPALGLPLDIDYRNQSWGVQAKWVYERDFKTQRHQWTWLYDFRLDKFRDASPLKTALLTGDKSRRIHAFFLQDEISFLSDKVVLNPSLRYEHASDRGLRRALHLGVVGKPWPWLTFKANIENSFRYPNFNELFFPNQGFIRGNAQLKDERSLHVDAGLRFEHKFFETEWSYFRQRIDNSIVFVPVSAFTLAPVNTGAATAQGFEASVKLSPFSFWDLSGNYTFLQSRLDGSKKQLPGRPRHRAHGRMDFHLKHISLFGALHYLDAMPLDFAGSARLSHRLLVDAGATLHFKKHYFVSAEGKNLGNVQVFDSVGFPLPKASVFLSFGYKR